MTQLIHHATPMPETNDAFDLVGLARATARRWPIVIITPLLTIGLAHFTIPLLPVDYRASAQLLIFDPLRASTAALGRDVAPVHDLDPIAINTEVEVIRSASALRQLALTLRLDKVPEFNSLGVRQQLITLFGLDRGAPLSKAPAAGVEETGLGRAVLALGKRISVERVSLSYVVTVSASAGSPELAYRLVTGLLSNYLGDQEELSQQSLTQSADWVRDKIAEVQARASDTRAEIERLRTEGGVSQDGKATLLQQQRADLSAKLVAVRAELTERKSRLEMAAAATTAAGDDVGSSPGQLTSPALDQLRQQLSQLLRDTAQVSARFGAQHLHVIAMDDRATSLRRAIIDETARLTAEEQTNYELAQRREQALVIEVNRLGRAEMDAGVLTRLQELQRVADADAKLLDAYSGRLEKVGAAASLGNAGRRILSPASMPSAPNSPRKPLIYAGAGAAGLILGGALALLMGYRLGTIPPAGPGQNRFGHPVFGNLPLLKGRSSRRAKDKAAAAMAHAMRCVRVGLQLHTRNGNPKVVVVTSSVRGEGRTTVAAALATETARSGIRTVLVDCDLASPLGLMPIDDRWPASGGALLTRARPREPRPERPGDRVLHHCGQRPAARRRLGPSRSRPVSRGPRALDRDIWLRRHRRAPAAADPRSQRDGRVRRRSAAGHRRDRLPRQPGAAIADGAWRQGGVLDRDRAQQAAASGSAAGWLGIDRTRSGFSRKAAALAIGRRAAARWRRRRGRADITVMSSMPRHSRSSRDRPCANVATEFCFTSGDLE